MSGKMSKIYYFDEGGKHNSEMTYKLARERAEELGIKNVVIASIRGKSVPGVMRAFEGSGVKLWFASCDACNNCPRFDLDMKKLLESKGHEMILINEHAYPYPDAAVLANRRISQGFKETIHLAIGVAEEGYIPPGEEIIGISGTGWFDYAKGGGADTAVVLEATLAKDFWSYEEKLKEHKTKGMKIKEIICMPR